MRLRDDWIAVPDWLNEKRCEDSPALQLRKPSRDRTAHEFLMRRNYLGAALGVQRVLASL